MAIILKESHVTPYNRQLILTHPDFCHMTIHITTNVTTYWLRAIFREYIKDRVFSHALGVINHIRIKKDGLLFWPPTCIRQTH